MPLMRQGIESTYQIRIWSEVGLSIVTFSCKGRGTLAGDAVLRSLNVLHRVYEWSIESIHRVRGGHQQLTEVCNFSLQLLHLYPLNRHLCLFSRLQIWISL